MFVPTEILREIRGALVQALYILDHNQHARLDHPDVIERIRRVREMVEVLIDTGPGRPAA